MIGITPDWLTLGAAFLAGLLGSGHCVAMCGGIATGFSAMQARGGWGAALQANGGRVGGYVMAGLLAGLVGSSLVALARSDTVIMVTRMAVGLVLLIVSLRLLHVRGRIARFAATPGMRVWQRLQPLVRRIGPANTPVRRVLLGVVWGWLPCGLSTTLLLAAWLQGDAVHGAITMAAFGLGTLPVMLPLTWSGQRIGRTLQRPMWRRSAAAFVAGAGVLTIAAPWLMQHPQMHGVLAMLGCISARPAG